jgi:hypothetical protein
MMPHLLADTYKALVDGANDGDGQIGKWSGMISVKRDLNELVLEDINRVSHLL